MKVPQWQESSLGEIAEYINGRAFKPTEWEIEGVPIIRIQNLNNPTAVYNYYSKFLEEKYSVKHGDLLYAWSASLDSYIWRGGDACLNQHIFNVKPFAGISKNFIFYLLKYVSADILSQTHGSGMVHITKGKFEKIKIFLPALAEQHYLADKLDSLLARIQTLSDQLAAVPALLKQFRQSVLADAVSGKLTAEWRSSQDIDKAWEKKKLSDIVTQIEAGKNIKCIETPPNHNEYGIVKISAVTWGVFDEAESKTLHKSKDFLENRRIKEGDFLISRANTLELVGSPVIVETISKNLMLSDKVLRLCMPEQDKKWVLIFMRSANGRAEIEKRATGNQLSMRNIGQKALLDIDLPKPSIAEQTEIVRRVETLFALADNIEQQSRAAAERVALLTQSVLAKAFRGELSEQWRREHPDLISGDNSAAALLARIQAERAATGKKSRRA